VGRRMPQNPWGIQRAAGQFHLLFAITLPALLGLAVVCLASLVLRFRSSRGVQRQQLKWFTYAALLGIGTWALLDSTGGTDRLPNPLHVIATILGLWIIRAAIGVAILRYRLYDIDRLIHRTLVYGLLTAVLGLAYAGVVLGLGQLFENDVTRYPPSWLVAGATLAMAALFQPARRRIQAVVDRRFNRRRYNAAKTVETFGLRLRDEVDLDALAAELLTVVDQTMQPTRTSLWLRQSAKPR
jgi:hypothetical protein